MKQQTGLEVDVLVTGTMGKCKDLARRSDQSIINMEDHMGCSYYVPCIMYLPKVVQGKKTSEKVTGPQISVQTSICGGQTSLTNVGPILQLTELEGYVAITFRGLIRSIL